MHKVLLASGLFICSLAAAASTSAQQKENLDAEGHQWWQHAVFYEVYPRSFADSNNDGIGDLNGIASKLDYLKELGVDAIWITPFFPSPQVDFGYDVSDYENIDPMYGTLKDFDHLISESKKRNIRIILDFVVNHTSDKHKWFVDSQSSRTSAHRDWYIWRDGRAPGQPPNNWLSTFGTPGWTFDPKTNQYYYHYFYPEQPDLNWRNPAVEKAMLDENRFWYKRGVAGFRLDAVDTLFEDPALKDNPIIPGTDNFGRPKMDEIYNKKLPEVHDVMRKLRSTANEYGAVLIGETWTSNVGELKEYYGAKNDELQLPMDLMMTGFRGLSADEYRKHIAAVNAAGNWPVYVISNHDIIRSYTRYADGEHNDDIAKLMAALYLTLRGTAVMYYGEEIGMENNTPKNREDVQDPIGKIGWPLEKGRDGERTPMQWNDKPNAGFSSVKPWLPVPPSYKTHNVDTEKKDPNSVLSFYRQLLALRHHEPALLEGSYIALNEDDPNVLTFVRQYKNDAILVALNMSAGQQKLLLDLSALGFNAPKLSMLLTDFHKALPSAANDLAMEPYSVFIAKITK
ncbi:MAG TPA: alpha-glucosidase [Candidatus Eremiobacteraceae bacterium]|nr:alpha-glucosidase [Candidatus Eremiobacteraceae bacterium]